MEKLKKLTTYQMAVTALMAAALCVLGPAERAHRSHSQFRCQTLSSV